MCLKEVEKKNDNSLKGTANVCNQDVWGLLGDVGIEKSTGNYDDTFELLEPVESPKSQLSYAELMPLLHAFLFCVFGKASRHFFRTNT